MWYASLANKIGRRAVIALACTGELLSLLCVMLVGMAPTHHRRLFTADELYRLHWNRQAHRVDMASISDAYDRGWPVSLICNVCRSSH